MDISVLIMLAVGWLPCRETGFYLEAKMVLSACGIILAFRALQPLTSFQGYGTLAQMIFHLIGDLVQFVVVFGALLALYALNMHAMFSSNQSTPGYDTMQDSFVTLFSSALGEFDFDRLELYDPPHRQFTLMYTWFAVVLCLFLMLVTLLLLNLLIAKFANTYARIQSHSSEVWYQVTKSTSSACIPMPV